MSSGFRYRHRETGGNIGSGLASILRLSRPVRRRLRSPGRPRTATGPFVGGGHGKAAASPWAARSTICSTTSSTRYARPNPRGVDEIERCFNVDVRPRLGDEARHELRRQDIVELLDAIEDAVHPVQATGRWRM